MYHHKYPATSLFTMRKSIEDFAKQLLAMKIRQQLVEAAKHVRRQMAIARIEARLRLIQYGED